jgi:hypothetical protein
VRPQGLLRAACLLHQLHSHQGLWTATRNHQLSFFMMEVATRTDPSSSSKADTSGNDLVFLYRLAPGYASSNYGVSD